MPLCLGEAPPSVRVAVGAWCAASGGCKGGEGTDGSCRVFLTSNQACASRRASFPLHAAGWSREVRSGAIVMSRMCEALRTSRKEGFG